ncbi:tetratricopeptide repeat protein [Corallococcus sicarius]|uniref:Serine protease n=1 Tax=Corallococcus sicarius TaxID=2316726 RepID=A0A3A8NBU3_9BACT|nr:tetratricopeptide repeat protein [Corallococcus sicarius]RKH41453.1 hypothetical protein D7X12_18140 [Corallococcus sicarius]
MPGGIDSSRLAKVVVEVEQGDYRVGTAYAVTPTRLLTARHVIQGMVGEAPPVRVEVGFSEGVWRDVQVSWESQPLDGCLLQSKETMPLSGMLAWGDYTRSKRLEWESTGFPRAARFVDDHGNLREAADVYGTLGPQGGREQGKYELVITAGTPLSAEAWRGLSGGPVFAEGRLIGFISSGPEGFAGTRLYAMPVARLREDAAFRKEVGELSLQQVPRPGPRFLQDNIRNPPDKNRSPQGTREASGLGRLLSAGYQVVPFQQETRQTELESLKNWCDDSASLGIRLFTGAQGLGKTRLFIEWCSRLRAKGWQAGFLPPVEDIGLARYQDRLEELLGGTDPVFITVDKAEAYLDLEKRLEFLQSRMAGAPKVRVALVARQSGDWWELLHQSEALRDLLDAHLSTRLLPIKMEDELRVMSFELARRAFATHLEKEDVSLEVPDLSDARFERILFIHMAALAVVEGLNLCAETLVDEILLREQVLWGELAQNRETGTRRIYFQRAARRAVAALTLKGGASDAEEARATLEKAQAPDGCFLEALKWLYPCGGKEGMRDCYLRGLEPDVLGERLVEKVLLEPETDRDYLERTFDGASEAAVRTGFLVLGSLSLQKPELTRPWLDRLLDQDLGKRARVALEVALALGEKSAFGLLGTVLSEALKREGTPALAVELETMLPEHTVSLREVAVWVAEKQLEQMSVDAEGAISAARARILIELGARLGRVGRREEALAATEAAVKHYRALARERPEAFLPNLAGSLGNLGIHLSEVGRREEALAATEAGVKHFRALARERPEAFLPGLADSLSNLGSQLSEVGRREEALAATEAAVKHYRALARERPEAFLPELAGSLSNLGNWLSDVGRRDEALAVREEAVKHFRALARERPEAFLPDLATSLSNLGVGLREARRREEALAATEEAVEIHRALARERPEAFLPNLADSLGNLGLQLSDVGRRDEALAATEAAVKHFRALARERPEVFLPDLAASLGILGLQLSDVGRRDEALAATEAAVKHIRALARERPEVFLPDLAGSLSDLGIHLSEVGRRDEALAATEEAVKHFRALARERSEIFLPELAASLIIILGRRLSEVGRRDEALAATEEAVKHYRALAHERPEAFLPKLAASLGILGPQLIEAGRRDEALAATEEAVKHFRALARERPEDFLPELAASLVNLGIHLSAVGRREEALAATEAAVKHFRALARERPEAFLPKLAGSLSDLGPRLSEVGRRDEALAAMEEAVKHYRTLARERPEAFLPELAASLVNLGHWLREVGRWDEALAATEAAVEIRRELARERPEDFLPGLAASLSILGLQLSEMGRRDEALAAMEEAVKHYRTLARERPEAFLPELAASLSILGLQLSEVGRWDEALAATEAAVKHYRTLARERPEDFLPELAASLNNLGNWLTEMGRREEALAATQEAVKHYRTLARERPEDFLPTLATSLSILGLQLSEVGRRDEALAAMEEAVMILPDQPELARQPQGENFPPLDSA